MIDPGILRDRVTIDNPSAVTSDGDGGPSRLWPPDGGVRLGARLPANVEPALARSLERLVAKTSESNASHIVTVRYIGGVTTQSRVTWHDGGGDRTLYVNGVSDMEGRHVVLALSCAEAIL